MSNSEAFVIPAGLIVSQGQDGLSIEHAGDIILHGTMGMALKKVRSTAGNVELHVDADLSEISAAGHVIVGGALIVDRLRGERVEVRGGVQARTIDAGSGGMLIDGDALVDALSASGDVTVNGNVKARSLETTAGSLHLNGAVEADSITTAGDLSASGTLTSDAVHAAGAIRATHGVTARMLTGDTVELAGENISASVVRAGSAITIGEGAIRSDILIAPSVVLSPQTTGKVTVVESHNELSVSAVKGCLSLADLEEFGLDSQAFLDKHGIVPLDADSAEPADGAGEEADEDDGGEEDDQDDDEEAPAELSGEDDADQAIELSSGVEEEPDDSSDEVIAAVEMSLTVEESGLEDSDELNIEIDLGIDDDDFLGGAFELDEPDEPVDLDALGAETLVPLEAELDALDVEVQLELGEASSPEEGVEELFGLTIEEDDDDDTYTQMVETVQRIESCYEDSELPPMITLLNEMVEARNYEGIRNDITNIWTQLLKFHQKRGLRIQPQVTTTFNTINKIVRDI